MKRKHMYVLMLLVIVGVLGSGGSAQASCPIDDPDCTGGGGPITITRTLRVVDSSQATLTGTGINCGVAGDDCTQSYSYSSDADPPDVMLTASGVPAGYTARIFSCTSTSVDSCGGAETQCGVGSCTVTINTNYRVRMSVADETAPSTATVSGPDKVGPTVRHFTASATDGAGVTSYRFYLDGVDQGLSSPGSGYDVPVTSLSQGSHTLTARARDASGNESTSLSAAKSFTVDRSTGATGVSTPPAYTQSVPNISFSVPGDASSVVCTTSGGGGGGGSTSSCNSPYTPQGTTTDGQYSVEISVTDDVGNTASVTKTFTLDRGAPNLTVTSPTNGEIVGAPFTPAATGSDGFSDVTVDCKVDSGAFGSCTSLAPSDGAHTVTIRASDAAGNTTQQERSVTYDTQAPAVAITDGPAEGSVVYSSSMAFTFTISDLTAVTRSCSLDDGAFGACTSGTGQSFSGLSVGIHTFVLRVVDAAGHTTTVQRRFAVADPPAGTGTTPTGSTGTTGTAGDTPAAIAKTAKVSARWRLFGKLTRVEKLAVSGVPKGTKVRVTCKGKGCAFKKVSLTAAGGTLNLVKRFKRHKLAAKTVITVTVTNSTGTKRFTYTLRAHKAPKEAVK